MVTASEAVAPKPLLRGVLHQGAFFASLVVGALLVGFSEGASRQAAAAVFAGSVALCFGVSALYHRGTWAPHARVVLRRLDHAGIYVLIAGTYTPVCLLVLDGAWRYTVLAVVATAAAAAIVVMVSWVNAPNWFAAALGIGVGWIGVLLLPQLASRLEPAAVVLLALGGVAYTVGAIVYARRRPNPAPTVFGYHELFHALTILGVACQYVAIAVFVIRAG
jgi:hemolysin III